MWAEGTNDVLFEGCLTDSGGIGASGAVHNRLAVRRSVTIDGGGYYFAHVHELLIEGNIIYRPDAHGMYICRGDNTGVVTRGNIVWKVPKGLPSEGNMNAIMQRPGGVSEGNVVVGAGWSAINMGACNDGDGVPCWPAVPAAIRGNLVMDSWGINGGDPALILPGAVVEDNITIRCGIKWDGVSAEIQRNTVFESTLSLGRDPGAIAWRYNRVYRTTPGFLAYVGTISASTEFVADSNRYYSTAGSPGTWFGLLGDAPGDFAAYRTLDPGGGAALPEASGA